MEDLGVILEKHRKWLASEDGGERANLRGADLRGADLRGADLRGADLRGADLREASLYGADLCKADLREADLREADLCKANLYGANLYGANLYGANLYEANLDFSVFPLWCGGTRFKADALLVSQVLAHLCSLDVPDDVRVELDKIRDFAKTSHRAKECGIL